jgi:hypothetical protein
MAERSSSPLLLAVAGGAVCGGLLGGALLVGVCRSGWVPWIIGATALTALVVLAAVPLSILGLAVALIHPHGRGWLADQAAQHLKRRHAVRLAAARQVPQQQHLHVLRDRDEALNVQVQPAPYRELPEGWR